MPKSDILTSINTRVTPQTKKADTRQVKNKAGGFVFQVGDAERVRRFLVLGSEGNYYAGAAEVTQDNAAVIFRMAEADPTELVRIIVEISVAGRAPKQQPAIFALAIAASCDDVDGRRAALAALPQVCRTGTALFQFGTYVEQFRGWGPTLRRAVGNWYTARGATSVAFEEAEFRSYTDDVTWVARQVAKYRQRDGWTHGDMLRLSHPSGVTDPALRMVLNWAVGKGLNDYPHKVPELTPAQLAAGERNPRRPKLPRAEAVSASASIIIDYEDATKATTVREWVDIIDRGHGVTWEMLPDAALAQSAVWEALIDRGMPIGALIRQLPRLTRLGVARTDRAEIIAALTDEAVLKRGRIHPINQLVAMRTYASGRSLRGDSTWVPDSKIVDAYDKSFYAAYGAVEPANKRTLLALDISGSMANATISGMPLSAREASAAIAMVTAATEPDCDIVGFTGVHGPDGRGRWTVTQNTLTELDISPRRRLDDICSYINQLPMGWTDCALPFTWAMKQNRVYDTVIILTDNESYAGPIHVHQALRQYRSAMNQNTRLIVVSMTPTGHTVSDPADPLSLDIAGFDSAVPTLISAFSRGDI
jgi:60 kDa SS-A/Ro ribonucleoprotein